MNTRELESLCKVSVYPKAGDVGMATVSMRGRASKDDAMLHLFVVDNSWSMGSSARTFVNRTIRGMFPPDADPETSLYLLMFSSHCVVRRTYLGALGSLAMPEQGGTRLNGVFASVECIAKENPHANLALFVLSDGAVSDLPSALEEARRCEAYLKSTAVGVQVRTLRLDTSHAAHTSARSPRQTNTADTRALSFFSLLASPPSSDMMDIVAGDLCAPDKLAGMATAGDEARRAVLTVAGCGVSLTPYTDYSDSAIVGFGETLVFLKGDPAGFAVDGADVPAGRCDLPPGVYFDTLLAPALKQAISYVRNIQITNGAAREIKRCVDAFETILFEMHGAEENDRRLAARMRKFRKGGMLCLRQAANTVLDKSFSAQQLADYIRKGAADTRAGARVGKRSRRTVGDVEELLRILREEIRKARGALPSLKPDDEGDPNYASLQSPTSFWSQATSEEGLRALLTLADDEVRELSLEDLLLSLNIVGFPAFCASESPDFPDAFDWSPDEVYVKGHFLSIADVMAARLMYDAADKSAAVVGLEIPRTDLPISIAIPCVMPNLMRFLARHMPTFLNALAVLGAMRVHAVLPAMFIAKTLSGALRIADQLQRPGGRTEAGVNAFRGVMATAVAASGRYFDAFLRSIEKVDLARFANLDNQPLKYAMVPLFRIFTEPGLEHLRDMGPAVLRSAASAMALVLARAAKTWAIQREDGLRAEEERRKADWKADGKAGRGEAGPAGAWEDRPREMKNPDRELMHALLVAAPAGSSTDLSARLVGQLKVRMAGANALVPLLRAMGGEALPQEFPDMHEALGLDPDTTVDRFMLALCLLGFDAPAKDTRIDKATGESLQPDLGLPGAAEEYISHKALQCREEVESARAAAARKEEVKHLGSELVERLASAGLAEFDELLRGGLSGPAVRVAIADATSPLVSRLGTALLSPSVPHRVEKLLRFYGGRVDGRELWNGGVPLRVSTKNVARINAAVCDEGLAEYLSTLKGRHLYRPSGAALDKKTNLPVAVSGNRHNHSNELPSYFGLGYATLAEYLECLAELPAEARDREWAEYCSLHSDCCGVETAVVPWLRSTTPPRT